jgi:hypothetical protein
VHGRVEQAEIAYFDRSTDGVPRPAEAPVGGEDRR